MGMGAAGHILDSVYWCEVERDTDFSATVFHAQYRDYVILGLDDEQLVRHNFVHAYLNKPSCFIRKLESITTEFATMLDITMYKGPRWRATGYLDYILHAKGTSVWNPLSASSGHPRSVHVSWPQGQFARIRSRFSSSSKCAECIGSFASQMKEAGCIVDISPSQVSAPARRSEPCSWLVLPYRPCFTRLAREVRQICREHSYLKNHPLFLDSDLIRISWALDGPSLVNVFKQNSHSRDSA